VDAVAARPRRTVTVTERNALLALVGTLGVFAVFFAFGALERAVTPSADRAARFVREATETSTRLLAVAHTLVATLFLATSSKVRSARGAATVAALAVAAVAACLGFGALGGREGGVAMGLFAVYFLLHDLRDEAWFYGANGDAPPAEARRAGLALGGFVLCVMLATAAAGVAIGLPKLTRPLHLAAAPAAVRIGLAAAGVAAALVAAHLCLRAFARGPVAGARAEARRHRPLVVVLLGVYGVFFASIALTGRFYALVATHVVIWYVFTLRRLATAPPPAVAPRVGSWTWMRTTVAGFNALHLGLLAVLAGLGAVWAFGFENDPSMTGLRLLLSREAFPYWTLVHVTLSWMPRR
jgi:hypothetical protein